MRRAARSALGHNSVPFPGHSASALPVRGVPGWSRDLPNMRDNYNTRVTGTKVALLPFRVDHAGLYRKWMQDPFIREMTGSEDLEIDTLEQAEALQQSVFEDDNNLTFLIGEKTSDSQATPIGDINLFLQHPDDQADTIRAEVNIMIGEAEARRKGLAKEALLLAFRYAIERYHVSTLIARIDDSNAASINLFTNKLNWAIDSHSDVFQETTFKVDVTPAFLASLASDTPEYLVTNDYDECISK